jgi:hypothetical protein
MFAPPLEFRSCLLPADVAELAEADDPRPTSSVLPQPDPREAKGGTLPDLFESNLWDAIGIAAGGRVACGLTKGLSYAYR